MCHCFIEGDIFEYFDRGEEAAATGEAVKEIRPEGYTGKVNKLGTHNIDIRQRRLNVKINHSSVCQDTSCKYKCYRQD